MKNLVHLRPKFFEVVHWFTVYLILDLYLMLPQQYLFNGFQLVIPEKSYRFLPCAVFVT